jgi:ABC-type transport system involved in multi-copper enzyme maturation permease subunit
MAGKYNSPQSGSVACAIGKVTFLEMIRDRVFYNVVLCAFVLLGLGYLGSKLTFVRPNRVVLDFGISAIFLACALVAIFYCSGLINKEIERRTIHVALCHPISRDQFVYGKFLGLSWVVTLNWLALCCCFLAILFFTTQDRADFLARFVSGAFIDWGSSESGLWDYFVFFGFHYYGVGGDYESWRVLCRQ